MTDTRTSNEIEREIHAERSALERAVHDLQASFSSEQIVSSLSDSLRNVGGDLAASISDTVRRNPVPSALIGFGLAWLAASAARSNTDSSSDERPAFGSARTPGTGTGLEHTGNFDRRVAAADAAMHDYDDADTDSGDGFVANLRQSASSMGSRASASIDDMVERITAGTEEMSDMARRRVVAAREKALTAQLKLESAASRAASNLNESVRSQPLAVGGAALVGGAIVGAVLPGTEREDQAFGAYRDQVLDEADRIYREEVAKLKAASTAALDETRSVLKDSLSETRQHSKAAG